MNGFEPKRDWKRYDPEPEPQAELNPIVVALWVIVLLLAVMNVANYLGTHVGAA